MNTVRTLMEIEKNKKLPTKVRELRIKITNEKYARSVYQQTR